MPSRGTDQDVRPGSKAGRKRLRRGLLAVGLLGLLGASAVVFAGNASAAGVSASFSQDKGGSGVHVDTYVIENTSGSKLDGWKLEFDLPAGATMGAFWNGLARTAGQHVSVANREFNGTLAPGAKTEFGFVQYGDGQPANCRINGKSCDQTSEPAPKPTTSPKPPAPAPKPSPSPKPPAPAPKPSPSPTPKPPAPAPKPGAGAAGFDGFTPYIDTSLNGGTDLGGVAKGSGAKFLNLAFIVSGSGGPCTPSWGGSVGLDDPAHVNGINALRAAGGDARVSFGGAAGQELGLTCGSADQLAAAYQSVIDKYNLTAVDFDIEGGATGQVESVKRRNQAIKKLQATARAKGRQLLVSYTLPVLPTGLLQDSVALVEDAVHAGVDLEAVNIMAMDYGPGADGGKPMGDLAIQAANSTANQLKGALGGGSADTALKKIAVTPMIGVNDVATEVFRQDDARKVVQFAQQKNLAWLAFWSLGRDNGGCAGAGTAQATCSSIQQGQFEFAKIFGAFRG